MNLPPAFISNVQNTFREEGHAFLKALPGLIASASARWDLTDVQPVSNLSYNFVAFARCRAAVLSPPVAGKPEVGQGDPAPMDVVLKMGVPNREIRSGITALKVFKGDGACRVLDYDEERCWLLLERLYPGVVLSTLEDDQEATHIAAEVMMRIWKPFESDSLLSLQEQAPAFHKCIQLIDWFDGLKRLRKLFNGGTGPLDQMLVARVESSVKELFAENHNPVLMHGDFHHFNILSSERGWLVIDPKGVIGPAGYEVGPFMLNPRHRLSERVNYKSMIKKRIDILHEHLGFERERILEWSLAHAVLSAWWGIEDNTGWDYAVGFAEMLAGIK
jgi:streptomycin 6-kinase